MRVGYGAEVGRATPSTPPYLTAGGLRRPALCGLRHWQGDDMANVVPKSYDVAKREYAAEVERLAGLAFDRYCRDIYTALYLCGTRRAGVDTHNPQAAVWERLSVGSEADIDARPEVVIVCPEPLPRSMTRMQLAGWVRERLNREPLAIFAD